MAMIPRKIAAQDLNQEVQIMRNVPGWFLTVCLALGASGVTPATNADETPLRAQADEKARALVGQLTYLPAFRAAIVEGKAGSITCA